MGADRKYEKNHAYEAGVSEKRTTDDMVEKNVNKI